MPKCPKCGRPMATVLKREDGKVQTYYECPACLADEKKKEPSQATGSQLGLARVDEVRLAWLTPLVDVGCTSPSTAVACQSWIPKFHPSPDTPT
jgi:uncharacterized OB-fold protein